MSILHTVNKSPYEKSSVGSCIGHALEGSSILFYEDAVYAAIKGSSIEQLITSAKGVKLYALGADLKARGIGDDKLIDGVEIVDYAGFVDLSADHDKVQAWV
jgi:tRNA 2-thiouridine synthesizing protein B